MSSIWVLLNTDLKTLYKTSSRKFSTYIPNNFLQMASIILVLYIIFKVLKKKFIQQKWEKISQRKKEVFDKRMAELKKQISDHYFFTHDRTEMILNCTLSDLRKKLRSRELRSTELVNFFTLRCLEQGVELNLVAELMYETAINKAEEADKEYDLNKDNANWEPKKLLGIPISFKDNYEFKGYDSTLGSATHCFKPSEKDGYIGSLQTKEGGIPFVLSTLPQLLLINEVNNTIWGYAKNPLNTDRSTGGSSGGETGLISLGCSPGGFGNDGGGSIRIPALSCGLFGLKPTSKRYTMKGVRMAAEYTAWNQFPNNGPQTKNVEDLELLMSITSQNSLFREEGMVTFPKLDWDSNLYKKECASIKKFGYTLDFPDFPLATANRRAVLETVDRLRKNGYECEEMAWHDAENTCICFRKNMMNSQYSRVEAIRGERVIPEFRMMNLMANSPEFLKKVLWNIYWLIGQYRLYFYSKTSAIFSTKDYWFNSFKKEFEQFNLIDEWNEKKIDAFILPGLPFCAIKHGLSNFLAAGCSYTYLGNANDFPTGALPITLVKKEEEEYPDNKFGNDLFNKYMKANGKDSAGLPVGIQVACLPMRDEKVVAAMKIIEGITPKMNIPIRNINDKVTLSE